MGGIWYDYEKTYSRFTSNGTWKHGIARRGVDLNFVGISGRWWGGLRCCRGGMIREWSILMGDITLPLFCCPSQKNRNGNCESCPKENWVRTRWNIRIEKSSQIGWRRISSHKHARVHNKFICKHFPWNWKVYMFITVFLACTNGCMH